jgi:hypothetical protein
MATGANADTTPASRAEVSALAAETTRVTSELDVKVTDLQSSVGQLGSATGRISDTLTTVSDAVQKIAVSQYSGEAHPGTKMDVQALNQRILTIELNLANLTNDHQTQTRSNTVVRDAADMTFNAINAKLTGLEQGMQNYSADIPKPE